MECFLDRNKVSILSVPRNLHVATGELKLSNNRVEKMMKMVKIKMKVPFGWVISGERGEEGQLLASYAITAYFPAFKLGLLDEEAAPST